MVRPVSAIVQTTSFAAQEIPVTFNTNMDGTFGAGLIMANENNGLRVE
jgi:hypothetical protein